MMVHMNRFILSVLCLPDCMDSPRCTKSNNLGEIPPFRPIVSSIGSCNYKLAKFLGKMLSPFICDHYSCKDTFSFVNEIHSGGIEANSFLVSYDIQSLFTNIP